MSESRETEFLVKARLLSDLWMEYRDDENFKDFIEFNDLGLPLAYCVDSGIIEPSEMAESFINDTFAVLLAVLKIEKDLGFETLEDIFELATYDSESDSDSDSNEEEEEEEEEEELDDWDRGYASGYNAGVYGEQSRIQQLCETYVEMYLDMGKGQKAVMWREVADVLKPVDDVVVPSNEDDGF